MRDVKFNRLTPLVLITFRSVFFIPKRADLQGERNYQVTLHTRRLQAIAIIMYKVNNGLVPPYIADLFVVTSCTQFWLGAVIYSKLDRSVGFSESMDTFAKRIKLVDVTSVLDSTCKVCFYVTTNS